MLKLHVLLPLKKTQPGLPDCQALRLAQAAAFFDLRVNFCRPLHVLNVVILHLVILTHKLVF